MEVRNPLHDPAVYPPRKEAASNWPLPSVRIHKLWYRILEKLIVAQQVEIFTAFYGTRIFVTMFATARGWSLSQARWIQFIPYHHIFLMSILISSHLRVGLPILCHSEIYTKTLYAFLFSSMRANAHFTLFSLLSLFWKNRVGLWDHVAVCVCVCVSRPIVAWQRLAKNPPIVARQRLGRNVTAVMNTHATIEELLDASFSMWPVSYQGK
jgi:hypothetical protein